MANKNITQLTIPSIMPNCAGDGCQLPAEGTCAKCGKLLCGLPKAVIWDSGRATPAISTYPDGHSVVCVFCRFIADQYIYCEECAGGHELMFSMRGSCRTTYRALHESNYDEGEDGEVVDRTQENATELRDRRLEKYAKMDSLKSKTDNGRLIRSDEEQAIEAPTVIDEGGVERLDFDPRDTK